MTKDKEQFRVWVLLWFQRNVTGAKVVDVQQDMNILLEKAKDHNIRYHELVGYKLEEVEEIMWIKGANGEPSETNYTKVGNGYTLESWLV